MLARHLGPILLVLSVVCTPPVSLRAQKPQVTEVLATTGEYLVRYAQKLGAVVAEEEYTQREPAIGNASRRLLSDVVLVGLDNGQVRAFRDVTAIDGREVRARDDRLAKLFAAAPSEASQHQAQALEEEGLRYYLSPNLRTLDMPTLALEFLRTENQPQSEFSFDGGIRNQDGAQVATLKFKVNKGASILPTPEGSTTTGKAWIDVATGTIRQTELVVSGKNFNFKTTTKYVHDKALDAWVPSEVSQLVDVTSGAHGLSNMGAGGQMGARQSLEGRARYTKYRRPVQSQ